MQSGTFTTISKRLAVPPMKFTEPNVFYGLNTKYNPFTSNSIVTNKRNNSVNVTSNTIIDNGFVNNTHIENPKHINVSLLNSNSVLTFVQKCKFTNSNENSNWKLRSKILLKYPHKTTTIYLNAINEVVVTSNISSYALTSWHSPPL